MVLLLPRFERAWDAVEESLLDVTGNCPVLYLLSLQHLMALLRLLNPQRDLIRNLQPVAFERNYLPR